MTILSATQREQYSLDYRRCKQNGHSDPSANIIALDARRHRAVGRSCYGVGFSHSYALLILSLMPPVEDGISE